MEDVLRAELWGGLTVDALGFALGAIFAGFVLGRVLERVFGRLTEKAPDNTFREAVLSAIDRPIGWTARLTGIWMGTAELVAKIPNSIVGDKDAIFGAFDVRQFVDRLMLGATIALATWVGTRLVGRLCELWRLKAEQTEGTFDDQLVPVVRKSGKVFLVVVGGVMIVQNLGYSVASLLAGLGLGGAALAFASKDTVANFFGSIVIFVDRPFQIGDWVEVGSVEGTVEEVGIRVTRIRTFANSLITIPNAQFTTTSINNWSRMRKRRIKMTIGLTYDTSPTQMNQAVEAIREIIRNDDRLHQDFYLVNFYDFGAYSLDIFCYLFTRTTNWAEHMQIREDFMLKVMGAMHGLGLSFAFPTQTLHLRGNLPAAEGGGPAPRRALPEPRDAPEAMTRDTPL